MVGGSNPPAATSPTPLDRLAEAVVRGARRLRIPRDASIVLAVSGGPDSMALLHGAWRAREIHAVGWQLAVAHLDHALRDDSAADARFVSDAAAALGLRTHARRADVAALARAEGRSIEDAGREARYRFLEDVAARTGPGTLIATAHTADDSAETVLLNLVRGSGLTGLRGIPPRRGRVRRPLIGERRDGVRAALDAAGAAYRLDPSNLDPAHARNRVRLELLPALERINPAAIDAVARFARLAADDDDLLDALAAAELARRRRSDGGIDWREPPHGALARRVLRLAIGAPSPSAERLEALLTAAEGRRGGVAIELGGGRTASVRERIVHIG